MLPLDVWLSITGESIFFLFIFLFISFLAFLNLTGVARTLPGSLLFQPGGRKDMLELVLEKLERDVEGLFCRFITMVNVRSKMVVMWRLSMVHWAGIRIDVVMQVAIDPLINFPSDVSPA